MSRLLTSCDYNFINISVPTEEGIYEHDLNNIINILESNDKLKDGLFEYYRKLKIKKILDER